MFLRTSLLARVGRAATAGAPSRPSADVDSDETALSIGNDVIPRPERQVDLITGVLRSGNARLAGVPIYLASRTPGRRFALSGNRTTGTDGNVSFPVTPDSTTQYELIFVGDATHRPSRSSVLTLKAIGT